MQPFIYKKLLRKDINDLVALIKLYEDVFEMEDFLLPNHHYLKTLLENDNIIFFVALSGNIVVGGLTAHILPSVYYAPGDVYIYDLAVKSNFQRQGIGRQLILALKNFCKPFGYKEIFVQADLPDEHAIEFYRATGGSAEHVIHFTYKLID